MNEIEACEERLVAAMRTSDVAALDALLADDLTFINHDGARLTKADDLAAHASGQLVIDALNVGDRAVRDLGDSAVVTCTLALKGRFAGEPFAGTFAYTRVWHRSAGAWRVVAAHCSAVG